MRVISKGGTRPPGAFCELQPRRRPEVAIHHLVIRPWLFIFILAAFTITADAAQRPPNIVLIVSDDHGYPDLGIIGSKPILTPHLDRLAREGVRATSFYTTWSACTPSRGSILTGRYPLRNGLYTQIAARGNVLGGAPGRLGADRKLEVDCVSSRRPALRPGQRSR